MRTPFLHYRIDGAGPKIVMLHPVGLDHTFLEPLVTELSPHYRILRMDLRGHGASPAAEPGSTLSDYAADVHEVLAHLEYTPAVIAGFSFGGMVTQVLAIEHPEDANALVITASLSTFTEETRQVLRERAAVAECKGMPALLDSTMERWFTPAFRARGLERPAAERLLTNDALSFATTWRAIANLETAPLLASIRVPTLCLAGESDVSAPPPVVEMIAKGIPGARFAVIPGAPHMLFIEQPKAVATAMSSFLSEVL
jgi:3-oxoadipate enol-lactonase